VASEATKAVVTSLLRAGLTARPLRAILALVGLTLGVTTVTATLVFADTLDRAFSDIFASTARGADVIVSGAGEDVLGNMQSPPITRQVLGRVAHLPGVRRIEGQVLGRATLLSPTGQPVSREGGPTLAVSLLHRPFETLRVVRGHEPRGPGQVAVDEATAEAEHLRLGQSLAVATERPTRQFTLVGLVRIGSSALGGTTLLAFALPTAQRLLFKVGAVDALSIQARRGTSGAALQRSVARSLPAGFAARTAAQVTRQRTDQVIGQLGVLTSGLMGLGAIAVLVTALGIFSSYSITLTQRRRELALLRLMGATRAQLVALAAAEALVAGALATAVGLTVGYLSVDAIRSLLGGLGADLPSTSAVLAPRTVVVSAVAGMLIPAAAAIVAAWRVTGQAPMAALRDQPASSAAGQSGARTAVALAMSGAAIVLAVQAAHTQDVTRAAVGGGLLVLALTLMLPRFMPAAAALLGRPVQTAIGLAGHLARENIVRHPLRSTGGAIPLLVGLALVLFVALFIDGGRTSARNVIERSFQGDLAVVNRDGSSPIPAATAQAVRAVPGVQSASIFRSVESQVQGAGTQTAHGIDPLTVQSVYRFDWASGSDEVLGLMGPDGVLVEQRLGDHLHLVLGSRLEVRTRAGTPVGLVVRGIYRDHGLLGGYALGMPGFLDAFHQTRASEILIKVLPGADRAMTERAVSRALAGFPETRVRSQRQLADEQARRTDTLLYLLYALLVMTFLVTLFASVNALSLSVHERTRELGLLRAVGMTRSQVRVMVAAESLIVSSVGALLGLGLGAILAMVVLNALPDTTIDLVGPWPMVLALLAGALIVGLVAAIVPARRAASLDILRALAYE
jgi:putative ABC transport system permease protein